MEAFRYTTSLENPSIPPWITILYGCMSFWFPINIPKQWKRWWHIKQPCPTLTLCQIWGTCKRGGNFQKLLKRTLWPSLVCFWHCDRRPLLEGLGPTCLASYTVTVFLHPLRNNSGVSGTYFQATGTVAATIATSFSYGRGYVDQFLMGCAAGH